MSQSEIQQAKERALEDLRKIREELLQRERANDKKQIKTEPKTNTILKLKALEKKQKRKDKRSHKKHKKSDKEKKHKRKERKHSSSSEEENVSKKSKHKKRKYSSSSEDESDPKEHKRKERKDSSSSDEEIVPKKRSCSPEINRDDWMTSSVLLKTFSKNKPITKQQCTETYEPGKSTRELNPYWKDGGSGLPSFKKPIEDSDHDDDNYKNYSSKNYKSSSNGWQKKTDASIDKKNQEQETKNSVNTAAKEVTSPEYLSDQQMNELGAKIMKAELLNNKELADELKDKLNAARQFREQNVGLVKESNKSKNKPNRKSHTEERRTRMRNAEADEYDDLKNKFEKETSNKSDRSKAAEETKRFNENFDDIFGTTKRTELESDKLKEIREKHRPSRKVNNCDKCFNSEKINKELIVSVGKHVYVALPWHEGLQTNHCLILPIDHYSCSTELDEDVWQEISKYRRLLTKIFSKRNQDVLFFETARYLQKRPHMVINCLPSSSFEMAPFYFKKAIEESEYEWSKNKQLVTLKDKNLRKSIPNGLPYFWINFGMDFGFAHVIENQENFPMHFAQEVIGGMLTLDMRKWRTPRQEHNVRTKVKNLADLLKPYELEES